MNIQTQTALGYGPHKKLAGTKPCSGLGFKVLNTLTVNRVDVGYCNVLIHRRTSAVDNINLDYWLTYLFIYLAVRSFSNPYH